MTTNKVTNEAFGQRLRTALAVSRISRHDIAKRCGVSPQAVQKWCDGITYPSSENMVVVIRATGCSMEWLMTPYPIDLMSAEYAPNGVHIKTLIRETIEEMNQNA